MRPCHRFRFRLLPALVGLLALAACQATPKNSAFLNRGPEMLLDVSSEVVNLSVAGPQQIGELGQWIERDPPTRAELYCATGNPNCIEAKKALSLEGVPTAMVGSGDNSVTLIYERILARDCDPRYVDDSLDEYNTPTSSWGCSVSANTVQQVSDKQEFVSPALSDNPRAVAAVSSYNRAYAPRAVQHPNGYTLDDSIISKAKTQ